MEANNKINHLFTYAMEDDFGYAKNNYVVIKSNDDITSKKIKSALKKKDLLQMNN